MNGDSETKRNGGPSAVDWFFKFLPMLVPVALVFLAWGALQATISNHTEALDRHSEQIDQMINQSIERGEIVVSINAKLNELERADNRLQADANARTANRDREYAGVSNRLERMGNYLENLDGKANELRTVLARIMDRLERLDPNTRFTVPAHRAAAETAAVIESILGAFAPVLGWLAVAGVAIAGFLRYKSGVTKDAVDRERERRDKVDAVLVANAAVERERIDAQIGADDDAAIAAELREHTRRT